METTKRIIRKRRAAGIMVLLGVGAAMCWAQQKGTPNLQGASEQLQQQAAALEQAKVLAAPQVSGSTTNPRQVGNNSSPFSVVPGDSPPSFLADSVRVKRNDERQKRLESDTHRLLNLANQLKSEVAASGAEAMTPEMIRQMDEIEKLAKNVKDRMRN